MIFDYYVIVKRSLKIFESIIRVNSWENLEKNPKKRVKKNVLKWVKNELVRVIGPVEFRKTSYFATWWRLVAREHDFTPKMKVILL